MCACEFISACILWVFFFRAEKKSFFIVALFFCFAASQDINLSSLIGIYRDLPRWCGGNLKSIIVIDSLGSGSISDVKGGNINEEKLYLYKLCNWEKLLLLLMLFESLDVVCASNSASSCCCYLYSIWKRLERSEASRTLVQAFPCRASCI